MSLPLILRIFKNGQIQEVKQFHLDQIVIGNNAEVDLDFNDPQVSPIHAMIEKRVERFFICDLGSESGTFKNGIQVLDDPIDSGDEIQIGSYTLHFSIGVPRPKAKAPGSSLSPSENSSLSQLTNLSHLANKPNVNNNSTNVSHINNVKFISSERGDIKKEDLSKTTSDHLDKTILIDESEPSHPNYQSELTEDSSPSLMGVKNIVEEQNHYTPRPKLESANQITKGTISKDSSFDNDEITENILTQHNNVSKKTFAPPSAQLDLNKIVKPSRGTILEISIAWQERIFANYHFPATTSQIVIGNGEKAQIQLPASILRGDFKIVELLSSSGATINIRPDMNGDLINTSSVMSLAELDKRSRLVKRGSQSQLKLDQGEVLRLGIQGGQINIFIRFVPQTSKPLLLPIIPLTIGEIASLFIAVAIVGLLALYISINVPIEQEQNKQDEQMRMAQIVFQKVKLPTPEPPKLQPAQDVNETKPEEVHKKAVMGDSTQSGSTGTPTEATTDNTPKKENHVAAGKKSPGQAADVQPNNSNKPKKFTSSRQGGAVQLGAEAGSNANTPKPVDVKQLGLASALTGGGMRTQLDQAVSGAGGIIGDSSKATGSSGFSKNRQGDDFGSAFKEVGAGGKGTATEGIAGGVTKGKSTGTGSYGSEGSGLGNHNGVEVSSPGFGEFSGTIDKEGVRRVIRSKHDVIARCYEKELRFKSQLSGKIVVSFTLDDQGRATNVKVKSSDIGDASVESCLIEEIQIWRFPEAPKGELANVNFPFVFAKQK